MIVWSASRIGCLPRGERSMIERRLWPKPRALSSLVKKPESSGPRWTSEPVIEERSASIAPWLKSNKPVIPHIPRQPPATLAYLDADSLISSSAQPFWSARREARSLPRNFTLLYLG